MRAKAPKTIDMSWAHEAFFRTHQPAVLLTEIHWGCIWWLHAGSNYHCSGRKCFPEVDALAIFFGSTLLCKKDWQHPKTKSKENGIANHSAPAYGQSIIENPTVLWTCLLLSPAIVSHIGGAYGTADCQPCSRELDASKVRMAFQALRSCWMKNWSLHSQEEYIIITRQGSGMQSWGRANLASANGLSRVIGSVPTAALSSKAWQTSDLALNAAGIKAFHSDHHWILHFVMLLSTTCRECLRSIGKGAPCGRSQHPAVWRYVS